MEKPSDRNQESKIGIDPILHAINSSVRVPGSKSQTNRALLVASLAKGTTVLKNALFSDDSYYFTRALQKLGFNIHLDSTRNEMTVIGLGGSIPAKKADLFIGNAGTAARFLTAFLALGNGEYTLDGDARMRERPIGDLVAALGQLGVRISNHHASTPYPQTICPPVTILASGLAGGRAEIAGNISSQFLSGLLMVSPYARNPVELMLTTELNSKPYVELTLSVMSDFGVEVTRQGYERFLVRPGLYQPRRNYCIDSDASAASYFFAVPAILGGRLRIENISRNIKQGDIAFLAILEQMGCAVTEGNGFVEVVGPGSLRGVDVDMRDISDTAQTLAAIAPFAVSPTRIRGIGFIRRKETNRIKDTCTELSRLGVDVQELSDGLKIQPCAKINPGFVHTYNDHRMVMAFSLIGLRSSGIFIENPACVSKTFPDFFTVLEALR